MIFRDELLITGANQEGASLALCFRTGTEVAETANGAKVVGADAIWRTADISKSQDIETWVSEATAQFGRLDILFNNAGAFGSRVEIDE